MRPFGSDEPFMFDEIEFDFKEAKPCRELKLMSGSDLIELREEEYMSYQYEDSSESG